MFLGEIVSNLRPKNTVRAVPANLPFTRGNRGRGAPKSPITARDESRGEDPCAPGFHQGELCRVAQRGVWFVRFALPAEKGESRPGDGKPLACVNAVTGGWGLQLSDIIVSLSIQDHGKLEPTDQPVYALAPKKTKSNMHVGAWVGGSIVG